MHLHFNGIDQYVKYSSTSEFPRGKDSRTIEFWFKAVRGGGSSQAIVDIGRQSDNAGSAFGIHLEYYGKMKDALPYLIFWGHNDDWKILQVTPDTWHFVALTYEYRSEGTGTTPVSRVSCFVDGELVLSKVLHPSNHAIINTVVNDCFIGGYPDRNWFFHGAVREVRIWKGVRTCQEIKRDMINFPELVGTEPGLAVYFPLDEGSGTTCQAKGKAIIGNLHGNLWATEIDRRPSMLSEGIWSVIQPKSDVKTTTALRINDKGDSLLLATLPDSLVREDRDYFLWRVVRSGTAFSIVNKKFGAVQKLAFNDTRFHMTDGGNDWTIQESGKNDGLNGYRLIANGQALAKTGSSAVAMAGVDPEAIAQKWLFQPIDLDIEHCFPWVRPDKSTPKTTEDSIYYHLDINDKYKIWFTHTVSEWAALNACNIYANIFNSFADGYSSHDSGTVKTITTRIAKDGTRTEETDGPHPFTNRRRAILISRYDVNLQQYPALFIADDGYRHTFQSLRGGSGDQWTITEEMMGRIGTYARGLADRIGRVFDQVIHEYGHHINYFCLGSPDQIIRKTIRYDDTTKKEVTTIEPTSVIALDFDPCFNGYAEGFPILLQNWFNNPGESAPEHRNELRCYDMMTKYFNSNNTWMPPLNLRPTDSTQDICFTQQDVNISATDTLKAATGSKSHQLKMNTKGDLVVDQDGTEIWSASGKLGLDPSRLRSSVEYAYLWQGVFYFSENRINGPGEIDAKKKYEAILCSSWREGFILRLHAPRTVNTVCDQSNVLLEVMDFDTSVATSGENPITT